MKKIFSFILSLCLMTGTAVFAEGFKDVGPENPYYDQIMTLNRLGIINGYDDGTFKPEEGISRAEAAAIICRAGGLEESSDVSIYRDISAPHWACGYVMSATNAGIINGMGDGNFAPGDKVTYNQMVKMIVCMSMPDAEPENRPGITWAEGYRLLARDAGIISPELHYNMVYGIGNKPADRQAVAGMLYNSLMLKERNSLEAGGVHLEIGMSEQELDTPDDVISSTADMEWYVYNTDSYENFYAAGVKDGKVEAFSAAGIGFSYCGLGFGDTISEDDGLSRILFTDKNDGGIIHGVLVLSNNVDMDMMIMMGDSINFTPEQLYGESKMNFHYTNAFRAAHGLEPYRWNEDAARAARLHSEDMAQNSYFSHTGLNGSNPGMRLNAQGIDWMSYGENINAGTIQYLGFHAYDSWVNSEGHRNNMLSDREEMGVGTAYKEDSEYGFYCTQNMVTR